MTVPHENLSCEILLTGSCNLSCDYCIAKEIAAQTLSIEIGRKAIELFVYLAQGGKTIEITFSGGEPLIAFPILKELVSYAHKRVTEAGMQANFVLKTNGTILNRAIIDFLRKHCIKVVVSIDGTLTIHDRHRKTKRGEGTYYVVCKNLLTLLNNAIPCVASITVHPDNAESVLEGVQYLHELGIERIDIGPAYGTVRWTNTNNSNLRQSLMDIASYMKKVNSGGVQLEVGPLYKESEHIDSKLSERWGCHAASSNLAFLPNGQVAGCSALAMLTLRFPELILGDVLNGINQQAVDNLLQLTEAQCNQRLSCQKCQTANNCRGGCLAINYSTTGSALVPPDIYCNTISAIPVAWRKAWM